MFVRGNLQTWKSEMAFKCKTLKNSFVCLSVEGKKRCEPLKVELISGLGKLLQLQDSKVCCTSYSFPSLMVVKIYVGNKISLCYHLSWKLVSKAYPMLIFAGLFCRPTSIFNLPQHWQITNRLSKWESYFLFSFIMTIWHPMWFIDCFPTHDLVHYIFLKNDPSWKMLLPNNLNDFEK